MRPQVTSSSDLKHVAEAEGEGGALEAGPAAAAVAAAQHEAWGAAHPDAEEVPAQDAGDRGAPGQAGMCLRGRMPIF